MKTTCRRRPVESVRNRMFGRYARNMARLNFLLDCPSADGHSARRPMHIRFRGRS